MINSKHFGKFDTRNIVRKWVYSPCLSEDIIPLIFRGEQDDECCVYRLVQNYRDQRHESILT